MASKSHAEMDDSEESADTWRTFDFLVVRQFAVLPNRCVKCNSEADIQRKTMNLVWSPSWTYLLYFLGLGPGIIGRLILQKRLSVNIGVCGLHKRERRNAVLIGWLGSLGGVIIGISAFTLKDWNLIGIVATTGVCLLIVSMVYGIISSRIVVPRRIENDLAWLKGASPKYLDALPELTQVEPVAPRRR